MKKLNVAAVSINTTPLDWTGNGRKIQGALSSLSQQDIQLAVFPELVVSGYGCEDAFFTEDLAETAMRSLYKLCIPDGMIAVVGIPVMEDQLQIR